MSSIAPVAAHEQGGQGGLSAAALAHHSGEGAGGDGQVHPLEDGPLAVIGEGDATALQSGITLHGFGRRCRHFQVQQGVDFLRRRHAVHGHVEEASQQPHGEEELRRQQDDGKAPGGGDMPLGQLEQGQNGPQSRPAVGDEVHNDNGVELHGEHLHGHLAKLLRLLGHLLLTGLIGLIDFQGGQALEILQEVVAQTGVLPPVLGQQLFGKGLHRRNGNGDEGHAHQQHHGAYQADGGQEDKEGHGSQQAVEELGQVGAEVDLQLVHSFHRHLNHLSGGGALAVGGPQGVQLVK